MEYRRFVAYIYEYVNGRKQKNAGFAKLESRNGLLRMQVSLQKIPREEETLSIYGFVREGDWLPGIFLGQCSVRAGSGTLRLATPAAQVGGSRYSFGELCGLWAEGSSGRKYITVFDDEGVDTTKLVPELPGEKEAESGAGDVVEEVPEIEARAGERTEVEVAAEKSEIGSEADVGEEAEVVSKVERRDIEAKVGAGEKVEAMSEAEKTRTEIEAEAKEKTVAIAEVKKPGIETETDARDKTVAALEAEKPETAAKVGAGKKAEAVSKVEKPDIEAKVDAGEEVGAMSEMEKPGTETEANAREKTVTIAEVKKPGTETETNAGEKTGASLEVEKPEIKAEADAPQKAGAALGAEKSDTKSEADVGKKTGAVLETEKPDTETEANVGKRTGAVLEAEKPDTKIEIDAREKAEAVLDVEKPNTETNAGGTEKMEVASGAEHMPEPEAGQGEPGVRAAEAKVEPDQAKGALKELETEVESVQPTSETRAPGAEKSSEQAQNDTEWNYRNASETEKRNQTTEWNSQNTSKAEKRNQTAPHAEIHKKNRPETMPPNGRMRAQEAACMPCRCPYMRSAPTQLDRKWQFMRTRFPHFQPFSGNEVVACLQITPRELPCIFQGYSRRANNSFLMHGFSQYRHLLFGRLREGGYILGVPGIFESQEMMMANMFGFPEFREAEGNRCGRRFGYWCRRI